MVEAWSSNPIERHVDAWIRRDYDAGFWREVCGHWRVDVMSFFFFLIFFPLEIMFPISLHGFGIEEFLGNMRTSHKSETMLFVVLASHTNLREMPCFRLLWIMSHMTYIYECSETRRKFVQDSTWGIDFLFCRTLQIYHGLLQCHLNYMMHRCPKLRTQCCQEIMETCRVRRSSFERSMRRVYI